MEISEVARLCHKAIRQFSKAIGEVGYLTWAEADQDFVASQVMFVLSHEDATPKDLHNEFLKRARSLGWTHGPKLDESALQDPGVISFEELPPTDRTKYRLFIGVARALAPHEPKVRAHGDAFNWNPSLRKSHWMTILERESYDWI